MMEINHKAIFAAAETASQKPVDQGSEGATIDTDQPAGDTSSQLSGEPVDPGVEAATIDTRQLAGDIPLQISGNSVDEDEAQHSHDNRKHKKNPADRVLTSSKFGRIAEKKTAATSEKNDELEEEEDEDEDELQIDSDDDYHYDGPEVNRSTTVRAALMRTKKPEKPVQLTDLDKLVVKKGGGSPSPAPPAPVNCQMHNWGGWSNCICNRKVQERSRTVSVAAQHGGQGCPGSIETKPCDCCSWTTWGNWAQCSKTCGEGKQTRAQNHNGHCTGQKNEEQHCNTQPCPVNCQYAAWQAWGQCDKTCDGGKQARLRNKTVQEAHGGSCNKNGAEEKPCNEEACPTTTTTTTMFLPAMKSGCINAAYANLALLLCLGLATP